MSTVNVFVILTGVRQTFGAVDVLSTDSYAEAMYKILQHFRIPSHTVDVQLEINKAAVIDLCACVDVTLTRWVLHIKAAAASTSTIALPSDMARLATQNMQLQAELKCARSTSRSHVEIFGDNAPNMLYVDNILPDRIVKAITDEQMEALWSETITEYTPPASGKKEDHQLLFDAMLPDLLGKLTTLLGKEPAFQYQRNPRIDTKCPEPESQYQRNPRIDDTKCPDWVLFQCNTAATDWNNVVVTAELGHSDGVGSTDNSRREGVGQLIRYLSRQWHATKREKLIGVFSNSWQIEIIQVTVAPHKSAPEYISTGILDFLKLKDTFRCPEVTEGFKTLTRLLCCTVDELSAPAAPYAVTLKGGAQLPLDHGVLLGTGGSSCVYSAMLEGQEVAAKVARPDKTHVDYTFEQRVLHELNAAGACSSIPQVHEQSNPPHCLITTPVGVPLARMVEHWPDIAATVVQGVVSALRHAHAAGWVHLDVRIANVVWIPTTKQAVLVDWDIALRIGARGTGLRGTMTSAANEIVDAADDDKDWFAACSMDWESLRYMYTYLMGADLITLHDLVKANKVDEMLAFRDAMVAERANDDVMKLIDAALASCT